MSRWGSRNGRDCASLDSCLAEVTEGFTSASGSPGQRYADRGLLSSRGLPSCGERVSYISM
jgi:hypothetical protein